MSMKVGTLLLQKYGKHTLDMADGVERGRPH